MKKKCLALLLALALCLGLLPIAAFAEDGDSTVEDSDSTIEDGDFTIEDGVLVKYNGEGGDVVIPDGVTEIGYFAFENCSTVTSVVIPEGVTAIGHRAFEFCTGLTSVTIPASVTEIRSNEYGQVFAHCPKLETITVAPGNPNYIVAGGALFTKDMKTLLTYPSAKEGNIFDIPDGVTEIGIQAFQDCSKLTGVTIPDSVTTIGYSAFQSCTGLTSVTIPDSVTEIGVAAFMSCWGLTSVKFSNSMTFVPQDCFQNCGNLTSFVVPESVSYIGRTAFRGCERLTSVNIPTAVTIIAGEAFESCPNLENIYYSGTQEQWEKIAFASGNNKVNQDTPIRTSCVTHSYGAGAETIPATCAAEGVMTYTCTVCGRVKTEPIPSPEHTFGEGTEVTPATCTTGGEMTYTCTVCGGVKTEPVPALEHNYDKGVDTTLATCAEEGVITYTCTVCGETKTETVPMEEHTFDEGAVTRRPTITAEGETTYTCTVCGETKTETIAKLGDPREKFTDLSPTGFYLDAVAWAVAENITTGTTTTTFSPKDNCTHGHILTFLWRAAGSPTSDVTLPFETTGNEYYLGAAKWAYENGMIDGDFKHRTPCTRADAVNYIWQAFGKQSVSYDGRFTDISTDSPYATAVAWALANGVTTGATETTFNPNGICNRGQIVTFLYRAYAE